jgi:hypothetical protein
MVVMNKNKEIEEKKKKKLSVRDWFIILFLSGFLVLIACGISAIIFNTMMEILRWLA